MPTSKLRLVLFALLLASPVIWLTWPRVPPSASPVEPITFPAPFLANAGSTVTFRELVDEIGLTFRHEDGPTPMHYFPEIAGAGVAWLDFDQDGYLDLLFVQGGTFPVLADAPARAGSRLFRNQGDGTFRDVTEQVGLRHPDYGQGIAVGDYDNDGFPDVFITCYGHCHLFHNESD